MLLSGNLVYSLVSHSSRNFEVKGLPVLPVVSNTDQVGLPRMATETEFVLPEKYTDDLKDENGNPMSKRWAQQARLLSGYGWSGNC